MPIVNDNSFAQGQAAGQAVSGAFNQSFATSAQFAIALTRMQAVEKQFKAQMAMQKQNFSLQQDKFVAQQEVNVLKVQQMELELKAAGQEQEQVKGLQEALPQIGQAGAAYFKAAAAGDTAAAFTALQRGYALAKDNPKAFAAVSGIFQGQGRAAEAFARANQPVAAGELPTDTSSFQKAVELVTDQSNTAAGAGDREQKQLSGKRRDLLKQAADRLRLAEAVSTVEFIGTIDPSSFLGGSNAVAQTLERLSKEMAAARSRNNLKQVQLMEQASTLITQQVGVLDREQDKLAIKQRMTDTVVKDHLIDSGRLAGQTKQTIAQVALLEASTNSTNSAAAFMTKAGKAVDELYRQMDADPDLTRRLHTIKYSDLDASSDAWESVMGSINYRFSDDVDPEIAHLVTKSYLEQVGGVPASKASTHAQPSTGKGFINLDIK